MKCDIAPYSNARGSKMRMGGSTHPPQPHPISFQNRVRREDGHRSQLSFKARRLSAAGTGDVTATTLRSLVSSDGSGDGDGERVETERAEHVLGVGVDLERARSRSVKSRDLGNVLVLALTLLLLQLERDTANGTALDTLHEVGGETGNLVAKTLGGDDGNLIDDTLVLVEVDVRETRVVLLDEDARGTLGSLGANTTLLLSERSE